MSFLVDFLKTGKLLELELGMTLDEVTKYVGMPSWAKGTYQELTEHLKQELVAEKLYFSLYYESLELQFRIENWEVIGIKIRSEPFDDLALPKTLPKSLTNELVNLKANEFVKLVKDNNLVCYRFYKHHDEVDDQIRAFWLEGSKMDVVFDLVDEEFKLTHLEKFENVANPCNRIFYTCEKL